MVELSLIGGVVYVIAAFVVRTWLHRRRTGSTGFAGVRRGAGPLERLGALLFVLAFGLLLVAPILALGGVGTIPSWAAEPMVLVLGCALTIAGTIGTLAAQGAMRESWRIGVDEAARTELVTAGPYAWVRNPIFTAMGATAIGLAVLCPTWVAVAGLASLAFALEIQVRWVEEPYLLRTHGDRYRDWAARTGRFVPRLGRLAAAAAPSSA